MSTISTRSPVAHVDDTIHEDSFLTQTIRTADLFTREELSEEQQLFGRTAAEFMRNEVLPCEERLYAHDWELTRRLMQKAASLDLTRLEIPAAYGGLGLD